jgi:uncharacterized protein Yka (UPF0111/DUF47 family)
MTIINALENAVTSINLLKDEAEQLQQDNTVLTNTCKRLEDEQKDGYKTFNTDSHVLIERDDLRHIIDDNDDVRCNAENVSDEVNSARCSLEEVDTYTIEQAEQSADNLARDVKEITKRLHDLLNTEDVQPLAEEGTENA